MVAAGDGGRVASLVSRTERAAKKKTHDSIFGFSFTLRHHLFPLFPVPSHLVPLLAYFITLKDTLGP